MTQIITLFAAATAHPCHIRRDTRQVDKIVRAQDK
jgi:hypothetical protein